MVGSHLVKGFSLLSLFFPVFSLIFCMQFHRHKPHLLHKPFSLTRILLLRFLRRCHNHFLGLSSTRLSGLKLVVIGNIEVFKVEMKWGFFENSCDWEIEEIEAIFEVKISV
ncbi:hypothetical protein L2E82_39221 [Cichorium intybus]|uniref:Uncharacterized protein n=1 Tax=Cichorium intybus TaxID=13427 RepID=A0ACB9AHE6_CICIN|nr:hypothetical protein L2E82_39221 [Cichorium intybus]